MNENTLEITISTHQLTTINATFVSQYSSQAAAARPLTPPAFSAQQQDNFFYRLAARAYQEAVKFPEHPPPAVWAPGDPLHSQYEAYLFKFYEAFREALEHQGNDLPIDNPHAFRAEWLMHARNIMDNIRSEWHMHPVGSMQGWKTTSITPIASTASFALQSILQKPTSPPPEGWDKDVADGTARLDDLHVYYQVQLKRFEKHMEQMVAEYRSALSMDQAEICRRTAEFAGVIIRENRVNWLQMFPQ